MAANHLTVGERRMRSSRIVTVPAITGTGSFQPAAQAARRPCLSKRQRQGCFKTLRTAGGRDSPISPGLQRRRGVKMVVRYPKSAFILRLVTASPGQGLLAKLPARPPATMMPNLHLSDAEIEALIQFLAPPK
jgi:hypothetical protein